MREQTAPSDSSNATPTSGSTQALPAMLTAVIFIVLVVIAVAVRAAPYLAEGVILTPRENDDAVMLISALAFVAGHTP